MSTNTDTDYDLIVIGAGVGGFDAAKHATHRGLKTALVECRDMGGTCINRGCIPSKALLAAAGTLRKIQHTEIFGISVEGIHYDRAKVAAHAMGVVEKIRTDMTKTTEKMGITVLRGKAKLLEPQKVQIKTDSGIQTITAKDIILATGSEPFVPPGIEIDHHTVYTSDEGVRLEQVPPRIVIIGSGYIGLEFSDIYSTLGAQVTIIEALDQLFPGFDPDIGRMAERILIKPRNIRTMKGVLAKKITPGRPVRIELSTGETLETDAVLVATGRRPNSQNLGLEELGLETERGFIPVDNRMATAIPHLWAIGDVTGKMMLAHTASAQGVVAVENILGHERSMDYRSIPAAAFTHPEIGFVGLTEPQAKAEGYKVGIVRTYFGGNSKAIAQGETDGICKLVYDQESGELLGAHILGPEASLIVQECSAAIAKRDKIESLARLVHTHPTLSEVLDEAYKRAAG